MKFIWIIFKKELKDITRDRRTLITMIIVPMLLFPILTTIATQVISSQRKKAQTKTLVVGLMTQNNLTGLREILQNRNDIKMIENIAEAQIDTLIQSDSLDAVIRFSEQFTSQVENLEAGEIHLHFKSSKDLNVTRNRLGEIIDEYEETLLDERFRKLGIDRTVTEAIKTHRHDVASKQEKFGKAIGGFIPYVFILFCFTGCMYPAIDLGAGEKERGTLETLLTSPVSRLHIIIGKIGVIGLSGLVSANVAFLGLALAVVVHPEIASRMLSHWPETIDIAKMSVVVLALFIPMIGICLLLLPLVIFFASLLMAISIFARSFKEAQSQMSPLTIVILLPVFIGILPGIELNAMTALIPVLNLSLATKDIVSGTISPWLLAEVYASLILISVLSVAFCVRWFNREDVIFRGS
jgi:sodium transport system permease protein